jgi:hypothetical protein
MKHIPEQNDNVPQKQHFHRPYTCPKCQKPLKYN